MDEGQEAGSELLIVDGNPAELLEFEEESFYKMAFFIKVPVDIPRVGVSRLGRDAEFCVMISDKLAELPFAISLQRLAEIRQSLESETSLSQSFGLLNVYA